MTKTIQDQTTVLRDARASRHELEAAFEGLTDEQLLDPTMTGVWSGKDTLVHISRWDETAYAIIDHHLRTGENIGGQYDDYESWNARWMEEDRDVPLDEAKQRFAAAYLKLFGLLQSLPAKQWNEVVHHWARLSLIQHYGAHTTCTRAWRDERGI